MTTEERLERIKNKAMRDAMAKRRALDAEAAERNGLIEEMRNMSERIEAVITLANACLNNGVEIPQVSIDDIGGAIIESYVLDFSAGIG